MARLLSSFIFAQATVSSLSSAAFLPKLPVLKPLYFNKNIVRMSSSSSQNAILESPSAERNKGPIYDLVLSKLFPTLTENGGSDSSNSNNIRVLELAAGCGVHTTHFLSAALAANKGLNIEWHPSDPDEEARISIDARVKRDNLSDSVREANGWILGKAGGTACNDGNRDKGDAGASNSGVGGIEADYSEYHNYFDLITCINMIHIAPWEATLGLMECAGKTLRKGGVLVCYGPYKIGGTAVESNLKFDNMLKSRDSRWGVRDLEDVIEIAKKEGLTFDSYIEMPANNLSVLFRKA
jgi:SAM-dependent methyltransferase